MDFRRYTITIDDADRRIDRVVRRFLPDISLSAVYKLLRKGFIRVDGVRVAPDYRAVFGSTLMIASALAESSPPTGDAPVAEPGSFMPEILLETDDLIFINKPVGIPVHGEGGLDGHISPSARAENSLSFRTGPLHRLDRDTSGVIAFSRSLSGARWFSSSIGEHAFRKYYLGIARGRLDADAEWHDSDAEGKDMITCAHPLASSADSAFSLVRYRIITGRKHQIRIQTALHGHPLAGDRLYERDAATGGHPSAIREKLPGRTYYLHAREIVFGDDRLPALPESVRAPLPEAFARVARALFGEAVLAEAERA